MGTLTESQRDRLRDDQFAYVDRHGERHLPIPDEEHVRNAISRFGQTDFESESARLQAAGRILAAARRLGIAYDPEDRVARAAEDRARRRAGPG